MASEIVTVVNDTTGQKSTINRRRLQVLLDDGWREWTDDDRRKEAAARRRPAEPTPPTEEEIHRSGVLATVAGDPDAAAVAHEAETNREQPDDELLAALEAIALGADGESSTPAGDPATTTPAVPATIEHEEI